MAIQPIRLFGDPVLRSKAIEVVDFDKELRRLVEDLTDTMLEAPGAAGIGEEQRVGLAAEKDIDVQGTPRCGRSDPTHPPSRGRDRKPPSCLSATGISTLDYISFIVYTFVGEVSRRAASGEGGLQPMPKATANSAATQQTASAKPPARQASRSSDIPWTAGRAGCGC